MHMTDVDEGPLGGKSGKSSQDDGRIAQEASSSNLHTSCPGAFQLWGLEIDLLAALRYLFWDVWAPSDVLRLIWDLWMCMLLVYVVVVVPYLVAFSISTANLRTPISIFDFCVNIFFLTDVLLNFRTAYADADGNLVFDRHQIAVGYLKSWFVVDVLTSLPYDNMFGSRFALLKALRLIRMVRFFKVFQQLKTLKLLRVQKLKPLYRFLEQVADHHAMRMLSFALVAASFVHWAACMWYFVASLYGPDAQTWLTETLPDTDANGELTASNVVRYITAVYWATTTMTTVGYGDITAIQVGEKFAAIATMIVGASVFAYFMGSMAALISAMSESDARMTRRKADIKEFTKRHKLPMRLADKIYTFYSYTLARELHQEEADIVVGLPQSLRMQVVWHMYRDALEKVPFFQDKSPQFLTNLVAYLKLEYYAPEDVVVRQGQHGNEMYFIGGGSVELRVYNENGAHREEEDRNSRRKRKRLFGGKKRQHVTLLNEDLKSLEFMSGGILNQGQYFGEVACLLGQPRPATVVALEYSELYSLSRHDLEELMAEWPELREDVWRLMQDNLTLQKEIYDKREQLGLPTQDVSFMVEAGAKSLLVPSRAPSQPGTLLSTDGPPQAPHHLALSSMPITCYPHTNANNQPASLDSPALSPAAAAGLHATSMHTNRVFGQPLEPLEETHTVNLAAHSVPATMASPTLPAGPAAPHHDQPQHPLSPTQEDRVVPMLGCPYCPHCRAMRHAGGSQAEHVRFDPGLTRSQTDTGTTCNDSGLLEHTLDRASGSNNISFLHPLPGPGMGRTSASRGVRKLESTTELGRAISRAKGKGSSSALGRPSTGVLAARMGASGKSFTSGSRGPSVMLSSPNGTLSNQASASPSTLFSLATARTTSEAVLDAGAWEQQHTQLLSSPFMSKVRSRLGSTEVHVAHEDAAEGAGRAQHVTVVVEPEGSGFDAGVLEPTHGTQQTEASAQVAVPQQQQHLPDAPAGGSDGTREPPAAPGDTAAPRLSMLQQAMSHGARMFQRHKHRHAYAPYSSDESSGRGGVHRARERQAHHPPHLLRHLERDRSQTDHSTGQSDSTADSDAPQSQRRFRVLPFRTRHGNVLPTVVSAGRRHDESDSSRPRSPMAPPRGLQRSATMTRVPSLPVHDAATSAGQRTGVTRSSLRRIMGSLQGGDALALAAPLRQNSTAQGTGEGAAANSASARPTLAMMRRAVSERRH